MERIISVIKELSYIRELDEVVEVVSKAARALTGADGATFVLKDGNNCYYAEEDAIGPLWRGQRFPLTACISGWSMINAETVAIEDIYSDPRIPVDAYRPTFVKSLVMVPIRKEAPVGAIGNYWAKRTAPDKKDIHLLQMLADVTSVTIENVNLSQQLHGKTCYCPDNNTDCMHRQSARVVPRQVRRIESYIKENFDKPLTVADLATISECSESSLFRVFQEYKGCSPMAFVKTLRLKQAHKLLLSDEKTTVTGVAHACGFSELGRFSKDYALMFGELPSQTLKRKMSFNYESLNAVEPIPHAI